MAERELISLTSLSLSLLNLRGERQSCFQTYSGRQPSLRVFLAVKLIRGKPEAQKAPQPFIISTATNIDTLGIHSSSSLHDFIR